jgi:hypothetical protein
MPGTVITLSVPATVTTGTGVTVKHLMPDKSVQFVGITSGTFSLATLRIMGSNDGSNYSQIGSDVTADGLVAFETAVQWVRIDRTVGTTGTISATLCGYGPGWSA